MSNSRKNHVKQVLTCLLAFFVGFLCIFTQTYESDENHKIMGVTICSVTKVSLITSHRTYVDTLDEEIYFNDNPIAAYNDNCYLVPQKNESLYNGILSIGFNLSFYKMKIVKPTMSKDEMLSQSKPLSLYIYNDDTYTIKYIYLTSLPVLNVSLGEVVNYKNESIPVNASKCELYDYEEDSGPFEYNSYNILFNRRGNSSLSNNKGNFKMTVVNDDLEDKKVSLLNMRKDDDWILNGMGNDASYVKEKISQYIWKQIEPEYSVNQKYVELIVDNDYRGLYLLSEPCDEKTLGTTRNKSIFVKINDWLNEDYLVKPYSIKELDGHHISVNEIKFDAYDDSTYENIEPIYEEIHKIVFNGEKSTLIRNDLDNSVRYELYLNIAGALDNRYKNERIILTKSINYDYYVITRGVWDCDWNWNYIVSEGGRHYSDLLITDKERNTEEFQSNIKKLYWNARNSFYTVANMDRKINEYNTLLINSGVLMRNTERWNNDEGYKVETNDHDEAIELIKEAVAIQISYLDDYWK